MKRTSTHRGRPSRQARGFSLIELLVAVVIGLVVSLAVFGVLAASEARKRTSVALNDTGQSGAYAAYTLDRLVRSAGSGYAESWSRIGGCRLNARLPASQTLPSATALPAPFQNPVFQMLRLAPLVIFQGASAQGSDVLMVMSGSAGFGEASAQLLPRTPTDVAANQWRLPNTIGFRGGDLVMLAGGGECLLTQVAPGFSGGATQALPFDTAGTYYTASTGNTSLATLASQAAPEAFSIGNVTGNTPQFQLFGVGANDTLFSYDLLLINQQAAALPLAEGVVAMRAVYGVDTNDDGRIDDWVAPTGVWDGATLMNGSTASNTNLRRIVAIRLGLVMRSPLIEKPIIVAGQPDPIYAAPEELTMFEDLSSNSGASLARTVTIATADRVKRHRTIELTIPLRNVLLRS